MKQTFFFLLFCFITVNAQDFTTQDADICNSKFIFSVTKHLETKDINEVAVEIGKTFLGTDYQASALEKEGEEKLVINLTGLDCTTLLENIVVFARLIKEGKTTLEDYKDELTYIRYRGGEIDGYPSRLHYFSDWIYDNSQKGVIKDVTKEIGGVPVKFNLNFMSSNPQYYKQLQENPDFIPVIKKQEEEINGRQYYYIPKDKIAAAKDKILPGDLIAFTTTVKGLDISHVGIAVNGTDGRIHLLHAPQPGTKVHITDKPLSDYTAGNKKQSGIIVLRLVEP